MGLPSIPPGNEGTELLFLQPSDKALLDAVIERERSRVETKRTFDQENPFLDSPDVYMVKVPSGGIPARSGTTMGRAECEIFKIVPADELDPHGSTPTLTAVTNPDASAVKVFVYNLYPVKWYAPETTYIRASRDKFGFWLCEKPPYRHKVTPDNDIDPDDSGVCTMFLVGGTITVHLNWMHGGEKISAGKEAIAEYREDEQKWIFVEAECETPP